MRSVAFLRFLLVVCLAAPAAFAQIHPYFGVEAGVPITDTLNSSSFGSESISGASSNISSFRYNSETKRLLIGPSFRLGLVHGLGLEFDALYQRIDYDFTILNSSGTLTPTSSTIGMFNQSFQQSTANKWEFPLLVQYEFAVRRAKPFVEAGPAILHITATKNTITTTSSTPPSPTVASVTGQTGTWAGITTGGGMDIHWSRFHLRPEVRYSRWFSQTTGIQTAFLSLGEFWYLTPSPEGVHLNQNEVSFLLGLTF